MILSKTNFVGQSGKIAIMSIAFVCMFSISSQAVILTFDDTIYAQNNGDYLAYLESDYGGLNWSTQAGVYYGPAEYNDGYVAGVISGNYGFFDYYSNDVTITSGSGVFDWNGAWFTSTRESGGSLNVYGYSNGVEVYHETITLTWASPAWFQADWVNVDKLFFDGNYGSDTTRYAMDNFTYNEPINNPVPEPATMLLFSTGLAGLLGLKRKKSN